MQQHPDLGLCFQHRSYAIGIACSRGRVKSREESEDEEVRGCSLKSPGLRQIGRGGSQEHKNGHDLGWKEESAPHCNQGKGGHLGERYGSGGPGGRIGTLFQLSIHAPWNLVFSFKCPLSCY